MKTYRHQPKNAIRDLFTDLAMYRELCADAGTEKAKQLLADKTKEIRREIKRIRDVNTTNEHRVYPYGEDYPTCRTWWFEVDDGRTDKELDEYIESMRIPYQWRKYSPTGQTSTDFITWKRTTKGIAIIHQTSMDI